MFSKATLALLWVAALFLATPAHATVRYVAATGTGIDCTNAANPCASLNVALGAISPGDTIICLGSPRSDGPIYISKSVTIDCSGARGAIGYRVNSGPTGVIIGESSGGEYTGPDNLRIVRLRGLMIDGSISSNDSPSGRILDRGIDIGFATSVHIEDCVISNMKLQGIYDRRTGGQTRLFVKDTVITGTTGPGIVAASQAVGATVLDNVSLLNNTYGLAAATGNNVVINRSTISGNSIAGVHADGGAQIEVSNSTLSHNATHVNAFGTVRLRENDLKFSNVALRGSPISFGGNRFAGNASQGSSLFTVTSAPPDLSN